MTWFKPPYWVRSRTHLRNGCNRFPPCAALPSPLRRVPPCARPSFPPSAATSSSPPCAAATLPPFARLPPVRAALPRRYAGPSLRFASLGGWPPPLRPRPRRWRGVARPAPGAGHSSPRRRLRRPRLGSGWNSLAGARSPASGVALGVKIGGVLRGVLPRSSAARLRVGARAWMQYAAARREPNPPPIRARARLRLRASFKSAETADFQRRLSVRAFQGHFRALSGALGAINAPAPSFRPQNGLRRRCKAACNSPRASRYA